MLNFILQEYDKVTQLVEPFALCAACTLGPSTSYHLQSSYSRRARSPPNSLATCVTSMADGPREPYSTWKGRCTSSTPLLSSDSMQILGIDTRHKTTVIFYTGCSADQTILYGLTSVRRSYCISYSLQVQRLCNCSTLVAMTSKHLVSYFDMSPS